MASSAAATAWSSCSDAGGSEQDCETEALNEYTKNRGNPKRWAKQKSSVKALKDGEDAGEPVEIQRGNQIDLELEQNRYESDINFF